MKLKLTLISLSLLLLTSTLFGQNTVYKISYYIDKENGESIPITVEIPEVKSWELPNMSGNWTCETSLELSLHKILFLECYEDGVKKFQITFDCLITNYNKMVVFLYGDRHQHLDLECRK